MFLLMMNIAGTILDIGILYVCQVTEIVGLMMVLSSVIKNNVLFKYVLFRGRRQFLGSVWDQIFSRWCAAGLILFENVLRLGIFWGVHVKFMSIVLCNWPKNGDIHRFQLVLVTMHGALRAASIFSWLVFLAFAAVFSYCFSFRVSFRENFWTRRSKTRTSPLNQS